jgi:hypothetical protein
MHRQKVPLYYRSLAASYVQFIHNWNTILILFIF